tara:strand:- start:236 stop:451 length:216 start_codon:yes stop_codon:yes gene_type:complete
MTVTVRSRAKFLSDGVKVPKVLQVKIAWSSVRFLTKIEFSRSNATARGNETIFLLFAIKHSTRPYLYDHLS